MLVFRILGMHEKWKIPMYVFESESGC